MAPLSSMQVDKARQISLDAILTSQGLQARREGSTTRYKDERFNIVTSNHGLWFDNAASLGGRGAIDLILHMKYGTPPRLASDRQLREAIGWLSGFNPSASAATSVQGISQSAPLKPSFTDQAAVHAIRDDARWPLVESYLVQGRRLPADLVRSLRASADIYASFSQLYPEQTSVCFVHRNLDGEVRGATIRSVSSGAGYAYSIGEKAGAWFALGDANQTSQAVLVEAPIDAISYAALKEPGGTVIFAVWGCHACRAMLEAAHQRGWELTVGFDNDQAGHAGWERCRENYRLLYPGDPQPCRTLPAGKDWNDDLRAAPRRSHGRRL